jgi:flagellar hook-length control protein FliK
VVPTTGNSVGADIGTSPKAALVTPLSTSLGTPRPAGGANASNAQGLASVSATSGKQGVGKTTVDPSQATSEVNDTEATRRAERGAEVLRQIRLNLTGAAREVSIQLRPAELGRIQIRLGVRGGEASAEVTVERQETLDLLRGHLPELRAALAERGLDSGEINLGLWDGNGEWGEREDNAGQRPVMAGSLKALAETTNEAWMDWLDPDVGVDLYA